MLKPTAALILFVIACPSAVAEEYSEEKLQKIMTIDYRGLDFSSNQSDLLQTIPSAKLSEDHPGSDIGVLTYEIRDDPVIDCVLLRFFDDALVEIKYFYFPTTVASMGGAQPLTSLAVEKYGSPTKRINEKLFWDYPTIDRMVAVSSEDRLWSMRLLHRSRCMEISDYKDTSVAPKKSQILITAGPLVSFAHKPSKSVPGTISEAIDRVPSAAMEAILRNAKLDHPGDSSSQDYFVSKQVRAYHEWKGHRCPREMPTRDYKFLRSKIYNDNPSNYSMQIHLLRKQLLAYAEMESISTPSGVAGSHFFRLKGSAAHKWPNNYSMQLFVLKGYINKYLLYREAGNSGESIVRYVLRYE